jgi:G6PDH family F420-dependent oxidoreductase
LPELGLFISAEEHSGSFLVRSARQAEEAGFRSVMVSDHFHPWLDSQGHSPMVWPVLGAIAATTELTITTGVTCPTVRIHPAIVAQAAATVAEMAPGRFRLGVGSGEALNEHILGDVWPSTDVRLEMLEEAVALMREMWKGGNVSHRGEHYVVDAARLYEIPDQPIPVIISGFGPKAVDLASRIGDGFVTVQPDGDSVELYRKGGGDGPAVGAVKMCWAASKQEGVELAHQRWRNDGLPGELAQTLPMPAHFDQASQLVTPDMIGESIACGPDPEEFIKAVRAYVDAGFDEIFVNQIGDDLAGFLKFFNQEVRPSLDLG